MDARIVEFAEVLRQNGVRVSSAEVQDAVIASAHLDLERRDLFKVALRSTLIKREADLEVFGRAFDFFFSGLAKTFEALDLSLSEALKLEGLLEGEDLALVLASLARLLPGLSPLTQSALSGDRARMAQILRHAVLNLDFSGLESPLQASFFARRLLSAAGTERARTEMASLQAEIAARGLSPDGVEILSKHLAEALRRVEQAARREVERQLQARSRRGKASLSDRPFQTLSPREMEQMKNAVRLLAQKLKTRLTRKQRNYRRGALSVHRTLRKNLACGAIPMVPVFRKRLPDRPDLVVLCDVSDSVRNVSRMMLLFMYTLQELFKRVRSFVFVSDIGEVTTEFRQAAVEEAIDLATAGKAISLHANSNYGNALQHFAREQLGSIGRRTTVMIIGDGRNNYHPHQSWTLQELRRKSRRLLWICSEDRRNWGFGDSEMLTYARFCDQVVVVQSLDDLARVADQLVPAR